MNNRITQSQLIARLDEQGKAYRVLSLQDGVSIVVSQSGGRIYGPFLSADGESITWIPAGFASADAYAAFCQSGDWNVGGDRIWIAPEVQYNVTDRNDFWNTYDLPAQVDPGRYQVAEPKPGQVKLSQEMELQTHNVASGKKRLSLERVIRPAANPLRRLDSFEDLSPDVVYAGYEQVITIAEEQQDGIASEVWSLIQLNPGGELLIPSTPGVEYSDYYAPIDDTLQTIYPNHIRLQITGDRQYKVGYKAAQVFGRLGYYHTLEDGRAYLIARNFFNNPSVPYVEEPAHVPGRQGHSIHVYNDDGALGGFGELEVNGQTIGGESGNSTVTDHLLFWLFVGSPEQVKQIALHLLGVKV
jgi:hypothetical protein